MGGWRASASLLLNHASRRRPRTTLVNNPSFLLIFGPSAAYSSSCTPCRRPPQGICSSFWVRPFSGYPSRVPAYASDNESGCHDSAQNFPMELKEDESDLGKIPVKAYFLSTSIDLKNMQGENLINVVPPTSRSTNYIVLKYYDYQPEITALGIKESLSTRYMVVFQYGSAVLINIEDHEVESYLDLVRRHASGLLPEMRKDDYAIKEKPRLINDMQGGPDYIVLRSLDTDSIRIIGSVLGQSIALDYFVSQVDGMVEEFAGINRGMEKTGTFTMDRTTLIKLVGKANSNLADVILKVGLFERSEIAWKDAKYAQIYEYLRDEYEVNQRFGSLDFKLKFVEHNIHFLQEVIQNRRSDLLEWQMAVSEAQEMRNFEASPTIFVTLMQTENELICKTVVIKRDTEGVDEWNSEFFYPDCCLKGIILSFRSRLLNTSSSEPEFIRLVAFNSYICDLNPYQNLSLHPFYAVQLTPREDSLHSHRVPDHRRVLES